MRGSMAADTRNVRASVASLQGTTSSAATGTIGVPAAPRARAAEAAATDDDIAAFFHARDALRAAKK